MKYALMAMLLTGSLVMAQNTPPPTTDSSPTTKTGKGKKHRGKHKKQSGFTAVTK